MRQLRAVVLGDTEAEGYPRTPRQRRMFGGPSGYAGCKVVEFCPDPGNQRLGGLVWARQL